MMAGRAGMQTGMSDADACELEDYDQGQDPAEVDAALWATRRREGLDARAEVELAGWLSADPRHRHLLAQMETSFERISRLTAGRARTSIRVAKAIRAGKAVAGLPPVPPGRDRRPFPPERSGRAVGRCLASGAGRRPWLPSLLAGSLACLILVGGWLGWTAWMQQPTFVADYRTGQGQRLSIELPDGSRLLLDAASELEVRLYRRKRVVRQVTGQAMYSVASRAGQPFDVLAGSIQVRVTGTRFAVRRDRVGTGAGRVDVAVETGRVRVGPVAGVGVGEARMDRELPIPAGTLPIELTAGQAVTADASGQFLPTRAIAPAAIAPWRKGRVEFNDTPLVDALAELGRYGETGLVVRDPDVAALRLGGSFDLARLGAFADALPHLLPVRLERRDGLTEIVRRR